MFGPGLEYLREEGSHNIWTQANSLWFEDAPSLESCLQFSKTKSGGIPIMANIYIPEGCFFGFLVFFSPMEFDPDYKSFLFC